MSISTDTGVERRAEDGTTAMLTAAAQVHGRGTLPITPPPQAQHIEFALKSQSP